MTDYNEDDVEQYYEYATEFAVADSESVEITCIEVPDGVDVKAEVCVVRGMDDGPHVLVRPHEGFQGAYWLDISEWTPENDPWADTDGLAADDPPVKVRAADHMVDILVRGVSEQALTIDIAPYVDANPRLLGYAPSEHDEPTHSINL